MNFPAAPTLMGLNVSLPIMRFGKCSPALRTTSTEKRTFQTGNDKANNMVPKQNHFRPKPSAMSEEDEFLVRQRRSRVRRSEFDRED